VPTAQPVFPLFNFLAPFPGAERTLRVFFGIPPFHLFAPAVALIVFAFCGVPPPVLPDFSPRAPFMIVSFEIVVRTRERSYSVATSLMNQSRIVPYAANCGPVRPAVLPPGTRFVISYGSANNA
jgi:hypothetical protein